MGGRAIYATVNVGSGFEASSFAKQSPLRRALRRPAARTCPNTPPVGAGAAPKGDALCCCENSPGVGAACCCAPNGLANPTCCWGVVAGAPKPATGWMALSAIAGSRPGRTQVGNGAAMADCACQLRARGLTAAKAEAAHDPRAMLAVPKAAGCAQASRRRRVEALKRALALVPL